jgi:hypothetical protein
VIIRFKKSFEGKRQKTEKRERGGGRKNEKYKRRYK